VLLGICKEIIKSLREFSSVGKNNT